MRLPRKLKKGCRTLNGNPHTKWQRKGRLHIAKTLENIAKTAVVAAVCMDLLRQTVERIHPVTFSHGGIVAPPPPRTERMMVGESTGEIVRRTAITSDMTYEDRFAALRRRYGI